MEQNIRTLSLWCEKLTLQRKVRVGLRWSPRLQISFDKPMQGVVSRENSDISFSPICGFEWRKIISYNDLQHVSSILIVTEVLYHMWTWILPWESGKGWRWYKELYISEIAWAWLSSTGVRAWESDRQLVEAASWPLNIVKKYNRRRN